MGRSPDNLRPKKNLTEERLRATPFSTVEAHDREEDSIRLNVWRKLAAARIANELLTRPENAFFLEEFRAGLVAYFGKESKERIYQIYSDGRGLKIALNKDFTQSLGDHEVRFVEGVVRAGIESYGTLYLRSKGLFLAPGDVGLDGDVLKDQGTSGSDAATSARSRSKS